MDNIQDPMKMLHIGGRRARSIYQSSRATSLSPSPALRIKKGLTHYVKPDQVLVESPKSLSDDS